MLSSLVLSLFFSILITTQAPVEMTESIYPHNISIEEVEKNLNMGDIYEYTDFDNALLFYIRALDIAEALLRQAKTEEEKKVAREGEMKCIRYIAFLHKYWEKYETAYYYYEQLNELYADNEMYSNYANVINSQANIFLNQGMYYEASQYYNKAYQKATEISAQSIQITSLLNLGNTWYSLGNHQKSLNYYQEGLALILQQDKPQNLGIAYIGMGNVLVELEDFDNAFTLYFKALEQYDELTDFNAIANIYLSIGTAHFNLQNTDQAEQYYSQSYEFAERGGNTHVMARNLQNLGIIAASRKKHTEASQYYEEALQLVMESGDKHAETIILRNQANLFLSQNLTPQALQKAQKSLLLAESSGSLTSQKENHLIISRIFEQQENWHKALNHHKTFYQFSDSIAKNHRQIEQSRIRQLEKMVDSMHQELQLRKKEWQNQNNSQAQQKGRLMAGLIFIISAGLLFYAIRVYRKST